MHWHAELTLQMRLLVGPEQWLDVRKFTLRGYTEPGGFEERRQFDAVLQVDVLNARAFLHGLLRRDGAKLGRRDYRGIADLLSNQAGVTQGVADRHGREVVMDAVRWATQKSGQAAPSVGFP